MTLDVTTNKITAGARIWKTEIVNLMLNLRNGPKLIRQVTSAQSLEFGRAIQLRRAEGTSSYKLHINHIIYSVCLNSVRESVSESNLSS